MPTRNPHPFAHLTEGRLLSDLHARANRLVHSDFARRRFQAENTLPRVVTQAAPTTPTVESADMPTPTPTAPSSAPATPATPTTAHERLRKTMQEARTRRDARLTRLAESEHAPSEVDGDLFVLEGQDAALVEAETSDSMTADYEVSVNNGKRVLKDQFTGMRSDAAAQAKAHKFAASSGSTGVSYTLTKNGQTILSAYFYKPMSRADAPLGLKPGWVFTMADGKQVGPTQPKFKK